jgi:hypothetical protein
MKKLLSILVLLLLIFSSTKVKAETVKNGPVFYLTASTNTKPNEKIKIFIKYKEAKFRFSLVALNLTYSTKAFKALNFKPTFVGQSSYDEVKLDDVSTKLEVYNIPSASKGENVHHTGSGDIGYIELKVIGKPNTTSNIQIQLKEVSVKNEKDISNPVTELCSLETLNLEFKINQNYSLLIGIITSIIILLVGTSVIVVLKKKKQKTN